jgi:hypothetical protein
MRLAPELVGPWLWTSLIVAVITTLSRERGVLEEHQGGGPSSAAAAARRTPAHQEIRKGVLLPHDESLLPRYEDVVDATSIDWNSKQVVLLDGNMPLLRIHKKWHPAHRRERFPSVQQRVKLYMSNYYHPICHNASFALHKNIHFHNHTNDDDNDGMQWPYVNVTNPWTKEEFQIDNIISPQSKFLVTPQVFEDCIRTDEEIQEKGSLVSESRILNRSNMRLYCTDMQDLVQLMNKLDARHHQRVPLLASFGDSSGIFQQQVYVPWFAKHRASASRASIDEVTTVVGTWRDSCWNVQPPTLATAHHFDTYQNQYSPILWKLNTHRHFVPLTNTTMRDTPWEKKINGAVWRGVLTGNLTGLLFNATDEELCLGNPRCSFVLRHSNSTLVNAGLTDTRGKLTTDTVFGIPLTKPLLSMRQQLRYKVLISMEGNDVSSGLKWNLWSESVVVMAPPTRTSWAMEELLEPWIHYVPMLPDASDAEEKVQWVLDHDVQARRISERASMFIYDLVFHRDSKRDDGKIKQEIVQRYRRNFVTTTFGKSRMHEHQ